VDFFARLRKSHWLSEDLIRSLKNLNNSSALFPRNPHTFSTCILATDFDQLDVQRLRHFHNFYVHYREAAAQFVPGFAGFEERKARGNTQAWG